MDRRSFLALLGAAAVSVAIPEIWTPPKGLLPTVEAIKTVSRVSATADTVFDIILCGKSDRSEKATFDVVRPGGGKLLALALNTYGGILRWVAAPGEELIGPFQFVYSGNMTINIVGRHNDVLSFTVIEPEAPSVVVIPTTPTWAVDPGMLALPSVPEVFKNAWRRL